MYSGILLPVQRTWGLSLFWIPSHFVVANGTASIDILFVRSTSKGSPACLHNNLSRVDYTDSSINSKAFVISLILQVSAQALKMPSLVQAEMGFRRPEAPVSLQASSRAGTCKSLAS